MIRKTAYRRLLIPCHSSTSVWVRIRRVRLLERSRKRSVSGIVCVAKRAECNGISRHGQLSRSLKCSSHSKIVETPHSPQLGITTSERRYSASTRYAGHSLLTLTYPTYAVKRDTVSVATGWQVEGVEVS